MDKITLWFIIGFVALAVAVVIVAGVLSGGFSTGSNSSSTPKGFVATTVPAIASSDWTRGNPKASVTVIEYADYECPACAEWAPIMSQLVQNFSSTVLFAFRNFPLYSIHPDAQISSQAAEAAGLQGKYWEMHGVLYQKQSEWVAASPDAVVGQYFDGYAASLGLDVNKFNQDINTTKVTDKIAADVASGNAASIDHTPTFFLNRTQIPNPNGFDDFKAVIDRALASSTAG
ncbi:MAG: thioredoxin domain-containing protein [Minisyncoccia bacterium]|jgi:protein-disulfide isomerase